MLAQKILKISNNADNSFQNPSSKSIISSIMIKDEKDVQQKIIDSRIAREKKEKLERDNRAKYIRAKMNQVDLPAIETKTPSIHDELDSIIQSIQPIDVYHIYSSMINNILIGQGLCSNSYGSSQCYQE